MDGMVARRSGEGVFAIPTSRRLLLGQQLRLVRYVTVAALLGASPLVLAGVICLIAMLEGASIQGLPLVLFPVALVPTALTGMLAWVMCGVYADDWRDKRLRRLRLVIEGQEVTCHKKVLFWRDIGGVTQFGYRVGGEVRHAVVFEGKDPDQARAPNPFHRGVVIAALRPGEGESIRAAASHWLPEGTVWDIGLVPELDYPASRPPQEA